MVGTTEGKKRGRPPKNLLKFNSLETDRAAPAETEPAETAPSPVATAPAGEVFDYSSPYQTFGNGHAAAFQRFTEGYPDRRDISVYVWRLDPPIDRRQVGISDSNIEIIAGAVDLDALLEKHGSGEYHLKFNDSNVKPAQRAKCTVRLDDPTKPPNVNPLELVIGGSKGFRNSALVAKYVGLGWSLARCKNDLIPEGFEGLQAPPPVVPVSDARTVTENGLVGLLRDAMAQRGNNHGSELERAFQIADRLRPAAAPPADPVAQFVAMAKVFREMTPAAPAAIVAAPAADPLEHITKMSEFFATMGWTRPGAGSGGAASLWGELIGVLPGLFQHGGTFLAQLMAFRMMTPATATATATAAAPIAATPAALPGFLPPNAAEGNEEMLSPLKLAALLDVGRMAMESIESGELGDDFAERLCNDPKYSGLYDDIVEMGKPGVIATLQALPGMTERLAPRRVEMEGWLDRFLAYDGAPPA